MTQKQPRHRPDSITRKRSVTAKPFAQTKLARFEARTDRRFTLMIASFRTAVSGLSAKMDSNHLELRDAISGVKSDLANVAVNVFIRFQQIDDRFSLVEARLDGLDKKIDAVRADLGGRIEESRKELLDHIGLVYQEVTGRLGDIEGGQAGHRPA